MARRRKYYIPITRSGSSILASLITQWINQPKNKSPTETTNTPGSVRNATGCLWIALVAVLMIVALTLCKQP